MSMTTKLKLSKTDRETVRNKLGGKCAYCGEILGKSFHVDHFLPVRREPRGPGRWEILEDGERYWIEGDERECLFPERHVMENLFGSCPSCNIMKSDRTIEQFRFTIQNFLNSLNLRFAQYRFAKKYGLLVETGNKVKFYYENFVRNESS